MRKQIIKQAFKLDDIKKWWKSLSNAKRDAIIGGGAGALGGGLLGGATKGWRGTALGALGGGALGAGLGYGYGKKDDEISDAETKIDRYVPDASKIRRIEKLRRYGKQLWEKYESLAAEQNKQQGLIVPSLMIRTELGLPHLNLHPVGQRLDLIHKEGAYGPREYAAIGTGVGALLGAGLGYGLSKKHKVRNAILAAASGGTLGGIFGGRYGAKVKLLNAHKEILSDIQHDRAFIEEQLADSIKHIKWLRSIIRGIRKDLKEGAFEYQLARLRAVPGTAASHWKLPHYRIVNN